MAPIRILAFVFLSFASEVYAEGWPTFHGSDGGNRSPDTGLLTSWHEGGKKLLWKIGNIGEGLSGYSSIAIQKDRLFTSLLSFLFFVTVVVADDEKPEPAKPISHTVRNIEGWTVEIDDRLLEQDKELGELSLRLITNQLFQIAFLLPQSKVDKLQTVKIRLDLTHGKLTSAQYHPSKDWLRHNGYSELLAKCVHLPDAVNFSSKNLHRTQPWVMLHELAHAYHDQFIEEGFDNPTIKEAWQKMIDSGKYTKTLHIDGYETKHYALTDHKEFFAEFTEAFFGMNDFFPFNRGELKNDAPEIETLIRSIWLDVK